MKALRFRAFLLILLLIPSSLISQNKNTTVYIFLSETCPICQSYTLTLKQLYIKYKNENIRFVGVFPNYYSTEKDIDNFKNKYSIPFELILDINAELTKHFKATATPEVFVENNNKQIIYSGRIDDSFYAIGKRRTVISKNDLADAVSSIVLKQKIKTPVTQAVGCVITSSK